VGGAEIPCDVCSICRQWQFAVEVLAAGGAAGHTAVEDLAAGRMGLAVEAPDSTRWGLEDDTAVAGTEDVGGQPCRRVALGVVEEGERSPSVERPNVSKLFRS
jgi:hypothetical protein